MNPSLDSTLLALKPRHVPEGTPETDAETFLIPEGIISDCVERVVLKSFSESLERRAILAESLALTDDVREAVAGCVDALESSLKHSHEDGYCPHCGKATAALARLARALGVKDGETK